MADLGVNIRVEVSVTAQYRAVAQMRWRMLVNSLRTRHGGFEIGARILTQGFFAFIGLSTGVGLGFAAWQIASHDSLNMLAILLWSILVFWQVVPIAVSSFHEIADLSIFLRFPVGFGSYLLLYILFGLFDIGSLVGGIGLFGIWIGASLAQPSFFVWITLALALFAIFNIFLTRMIFAWINRWLAQRKTREILGAIFLFLMLGAQFLNPTFYQHRGHHQAISHSAMMWALHVAEHAQNALPPGLAANAISRAHTGKPLLAGESLMFLALYGVVAGALLGIRLGAEYRGESLGEAPAAATKNARMSSRRSLLEGSGPIAAVIEKEIHYLMRSGVMLYGFFATLIVVFLLSGAHGPAFGARYALPVGVAYSFVGLTRFIYNNLGGEGAGIQLYFLSPTPFRKVMLAKNIVHVMIFLVELALVFAIVGFRAGMPDPQILLVTICWLIFAVPAQLAVGNILSITMAYRMNMTRMSREQGAAGNNLLSLLVELLVFGIGAAVYLVLQGLGHAGFAAPVLLVFAVASILIWLRVLSNAGSMIDARRETLVANLYRAA